MVNGSAKELSQHQIVLEENTLLNMSSYLLCPPMLYLSEEMVIGRNSFFYMIVI